MLHTPLIIIQRVNFTHVNTIHRFSQNQKKTKTKLYTQVTQIFCTFDLSHTLFKFKVQIQLRV